MDIISKTARDYNKIAPHFAATRFALWPELEQFTAWIKNGQRILDWGCGSGRLLKLIGDRVVEYVGVDISDKLLAIARKNFAALVKTGQARFYGATRRSPKFPPNYFNLIVAAASFHHLPTRASRLVVLRQFYRSLQPGGRLIMTVWNLGSSWAKAKASRAESGWKKVGPSDWLIPWKNPQGKVEAERYYHHFSRAELKELLSGAGFIVKPFDLYNRGEWPNSKGGRNLVVVAEK